jgi:hypothetical protein
MRSILCAALLCAFSAQAAQVATFEAKGIRIVLMDDKCKIPELAQFIKEQVGKDDAMAADVSYQGRILQACWVPGNRVVLLVDEDLDGGVLPLDAFTKVKGI